MFYSLKLAAKEHIEIRTERRKRNRYNKMIAASQAKLAETKHVPGYTKIYA
jgi:hypothetical protein